jgi:prolipoprotein diacylglyceryltransferase
MDGSQFTTRAELSAATARDGGPGGREPTFLERLCRPSISVAGRVVSTFQICGLAGFVLAVASALGMASRFGLSRALLGALAIAAALTFFAVVLVARAIRGEEQLVYYHHLFSVLTVSALILACLGQPLLRYLDAVALSLGVFLACGRVGCLMVGCCHGRPHRRGLRYQAAHAEAGFATALVGVPLLPVQAIESLAVAASTVLVAAWSLWGGRPPGAVLAGELAAYAGLRFFLEFARGDDGRAEWGGLSEAQWTSLLLASAVAGAERAGCLPAGWGATAVAVTLGLATLAVAGHRRRHLARYRIRQPSHLAEIAGALAGGAARGSSEGGQGAVSVHVTSLGVRVSSQTVSGPGVTYQIVTLSGVNGDGARALAALIQSLLPARARTELIERRPGVFHLLLATST